MDIECRIRIVLIGAPTVMVRERRATARPAFDITATAAKTALRRTLEKIGRSTTKRSRRARAAKHGA